MITITDTAREKIVELKGKSEHPIKGLRVGAIARSPIRAEFTMSFIKDGEPISPDDATFPCNGFDVYIDSQSAPFLEEATVDYVENLTGSGFKVDAPPRTLPTAEGPIAERIQQLLDEQINPSLASHGGGATLIDVKDGIAFIEMGGGCQGCAMSQMTLKNGIETLIKENIPEITEVLDVTDHAEGRNPYYQA